MEPPKMKGSSMGNISSVSSNLSMHSAIKQLSMNDSAVKFYLNKRVVDGEGLLAKEEEITIQSLSDIAVGAESCRLLRV